MAQIISKESFKVMPWKNGGGITQEILCLKNESDEIIFRLSMALVNTDGDFSVFPNIDRILLLIKGNGMKLDFKLDNSSFNLIHPHTPLDFRGEALVFSTLIDGECLDFNVMTNRDYGRSLVEVKEFKAHEIIQTPHANEQIFLFDPLHMDLIILNPLESFKLEKSTRIYYLISLRLN